MHALQARLKNHGDITVVQFSGRIDIESAPPFRQACRTQLKGKKIVFDFSQLSFVGSTGILPFLEALEEFTKVPGHGAKFSGVGLEFGRVLSATSLGQIEVWGTEAQAVEAYRNPRLIEVALAARESLAGSRTTPTATIQVKGGEPKNYGLLSLNYEADDLKGVPADPDQDANDSAF